MKKLISARLRDMALRYDYEDRPLLIEAAEALERHLLARLEAELETAPPEERQSARFDGIVDGAKREADRRALQAAITDEDVEKALEAANGVMVDTRRHWTADDRAAVRAMLEAVSFPSPLRRIPCTPCERIVDDVARCPDCPSRLPQGDASK